MSFRNVIVRILFAGLIIGISYKQILDQSELVTIGQDNIKKMKPFLETFKFINISFLYQIVPNLITLMNYSFIASAILLIIQIDGYILCATNSIIVQLLLINNVFIDPSSKCYLVASTYLAIYISFYYF